MLCSVQTSKSSSNWLDRLWSNRGFNNNNDNDPSVPNPSSSPTTNASNSVINSNSESTHSDSDQIKVTATTATATTREISSSDNKDLFFIMNNVLSDLFNMGGVSDPVEESSRFSRKKEKVPRKQTKPKFCFISGNNSGNDSLDCVRKDQNVLAATGSLNSDKNSNNVDCGVDDDDDDEEDVEEETGFGVGGDKELKGYSRSEVTVIDTSCQVWKFDKLVFRKKNVWKVRDKKGKSWVFGSKKRKGNDLESANGNGAKKKAKVSNLEVGSSKDVNDMFGASAGNADYNSMPNDGMKGEALISLQVMTGEVQKQEDERREEEHKQMPEDLSQVPKKRFHFSRSPEKSMKSGSSVILIKTIPTSNKSGKNISKNRLKDTQRKNKT
ncbi:rho GTPase-activating protein gacZ-like isoform X1 [Populus alba x Populus x berolinensis]|uniref:Rho GTPase-activating protein gacZ-like isoform X1 n=1 Tax=Populus alba x Populus x berolinensis TaxID=444605 RepID=A0AAD6M0P9_9ROSI|nr:rho GTPase-activating protein gacZ-like isoform X1 [Populus alba x Populus x berolinensis]